MQLPHSREIIRNPPLRGFLLNANECILGIAPSGQFLVIRAHALYKNTEKVPAGCKQPSGTFFVFFCTRSLNAYIIPPMPAPAGIAGAGSLMVATTDSVVSRVLATLVAFCRAVLVTFAGSRMPLFTMSTYSSL